MGSVAVDPELAAPWGSVHHSAAVDALTSPSCRLLVHVDDEAAIGQGRDIWANICVFAVVGV